MKLSILFTVGIIFASVFSENLFADTYFVQEASVVGATKEEGQSATELVKIAVAETGKNQVATEAKTANFTLRPKLVKLGSAMTFALEKVKGDSVIFSSQMKVQRIEELDVVANRLTRSVVEERVAKNDTRVEEVTEAESTKGSLRRETLNRWYFGFGPAKGENVNKTDTLTNFIVGYSWEIPSSSAIVKINWDFASDRFNILSLSGNYYFRDTDVSPFVGGGLGYGSAITDSTLFNSKSTSGFFASAYGGLQFFRTSKINIDLAVAYHYMMSKNDFGNPSLLGFRLGIYF